MFDPLASFENFVIYKQEKFDRESLPKLQEVCEILDVPEVEQPDAQFLGNEKYLSLFTSVGIGALASQVFNQDSLTAIANRLDQKYGLCDQNGTPLNGKVPVWPSLVRVGWLGGMNVALSLLFGRLSARVDHFKPKTINDVLDLCRMGDGAHVYSGVHTDMQLLEVEGKVMSLEMLHDDIAGSVLSSDEEYFLFRVSQLLFTLSAYFFVKSVLPPGRRGLVSAVANGEIKLCNPTPEKKAAFESEIGLKRSGLEENTFMTEQELMNQWRPYLTNHDVITMPASPLFSNMNTDPVSPLVMGGVMSAVAQPLMMTPIPMARPLIP